MSFSPLTLKSSRTRSAADKVTYPYAFRSGNELSLHFDMGSIQSRMKLKSPNELILDYTRFLMGFLLFHPDAKRVAMIGLGGGSIAKYCLHHLRLEKFIAIEVDPKVIALRSEFLIPENSERFQVIEANGVDFVKNRNLDSLDALIVDGFMADGIAPELSTQGFYDNCYSRLSKDGILALNFLGSDSKFGSYASRVRESFEGNVISIETIEHGNRIMFASKDKKFPLQRALLEARALHLSRTHDVNFNEIALKILKRLRRAEHESAM